LLESNDSIHNFWFVFFVQFSKVYLVALLATHISYHLHTTFVNKKFFVALYKQSYFDDLNILSLDLSYCQQEFKISFLSHCRPQQATYVY
ncbi:hypothetical protein, partial [Aerococcus urinaeequi]|uniref:hypothetical protein n=1 Tax=Aerococcus urinaeequi TaxID=51665 RepID=UPI003AAA52BD